MPLVHFIFMQEELMPPGAASGGEQGAQQAAASATLRQPSAQSAWSGRLRERRAAAVVHARRSGWARSVRVR